MSVLSPLRSRLARLRQRRAWARLLTAAARIAWLAAWLLLLLFVVDFLLRPPVPARAALGTAALIALMVCAARALRPALVREPLVDVALLLERVNRLDCELVAALQFDSPASAAWGSPRLRSAVIQQAASVTPRLEERELVSWLEPGRWSCWAGGAALLVSALTLALPDHARAFADRVLFLKHAAYPTRTRIERVTINGQVALDANGGEHPAVRVVEDEACAIVVRAAGHLPEEGSVALRGLLTEEATTLTLRRNEGGAEYVVTLPTILEPLEYELHLGDAASERGTIELLHHPLVDLAIEVMPPDYARHVREPMRHEEYQVHVLEGSTVEFEIRCTNGKPLASTELTIDWGGRRERVSLQPTDRAGTAWQTKPAEASLDRITEAFGFALEITDQDGLSPRNAVHGSIRLTKDEPPACSLATRHHTIVAKARPRFEFRVSDDFGIAAVHLHARRVRTSESPDQPAEQPNLITPVALSTMPLRADAEPYHGEQQLDLSPLDLVEGDRVMVTAEVFDYRGPWPGVASRSEPIELTVASDRVVLQSILEADAEAERLLTEAIDRELSIANER